MFRTFVRISYDAMIDISAYIEQLLDSVLLHILGDLVDLRLVLLVDPKMLHESLCVHILIRKNYI